MMHLETRLYRGVCLCGCGRLLISGKHKGKTPHFVTRMAQAGYCSRQPPRRASPMPVTPTPDVTDPGLQRYLEQREKRRMVAQAWRMWKEANR